MGLYFMKKKSSTTVTTTNMQQACFLFEQAFLVRNPVFNLHNFHDHQSVNRN